MRIDAEERSISEVLFFSKASSTRKIFADEWNFLARSVQYEAAFYF